MQRWSVVVTASSLMLLAAACGGDSGSSGDQPRPSPPSAPSDELVTLGESLYVANCQSCHGDRTGAGGVPGAPPHNETGHTSHHPDAQLSDWVLDGKFPGQMPAFGDRLSREQVEAVLAYIKTWWTEEQREVQANVSERYQRALDERRED